MEIIAVDDEYLALRSVVMIRSISSTRVRAEAAGVTLTLEWAFSPWLCSRRLKS
ncbi:hypothetical protein AGMMS50276_19160 [Synergistales bacterium]|nr:hypothetical protein AGMMS50276_19160 [Synergistales bacterium]